MYRNSVFSVKLGGIFFTTFIPTTTQQLDTEVYNHIANQLYVAALFGHLRRETFDKEKHNIG